MSFCDGQAEAAIVNEAVHFDRLSGVFAVQCLIYFRCYSQDRKELKALVSAFSMSLLTFISQLSPCWH
jgi:hypothetical protein